MQYRFRNLHPPVVVVGVGLLDIVEYAGDNAKATNLEISNEPSTAARGGSYEASTVPHGL
jgi:hypothetical protein